MWSIRELNVRDKSKAITTANQTGNIFVSVKPGDLPPQESDVHPRCSTDASFNWRYLFDVGLPTRHTRLLVQVWDTRATGPNDALAECAVQLGTLYANVQRQKAAQEVKRQWYACTHPNYPGLQAKVDMSIAILPREQAEQLDMIAGLGRGAPNQNPFLEPPRREGTIARKLSRWIEPRHPSP